MRNSVGLSKDTQKRLLEMTMYEGVSLFLNTMSIYNYRDVAFLVTEKKIGNKTVFLCDICGLGYSEKITAQLCEKYCSTNPGQCSVEISKKAVYIPGMPLLPEKK